MTRVKENPCEGTICSSLGFLRTFPKIGYSTLLYFDIAMENHHILCVNPAISIVILHSYVSH